MDPYVCPLTSRSSSIPKKSASSMISSYLHASPNDGRLEHRKKLSTCPNRSPAREKQKTVPVRAKSKMFFETKSDLLPPRYPLLQRATLALASSACCRCFIQHVAEASARCSADCGRTVISPELSTSTGNTRASYVQVAIIHEITKHRSTLFANAAPHMPFQGYINGIAQIVHFVAHRPNEPPIGAHTCLLLSNCCADIRDGSPPTVRNFEGGVFPRGYPHSFFF